MKTIICIMIMFAVSVWSAQGRAAGRQSPMEALKARDRAIKEFLKNTGKQIPESKKPKLKVLINEMVDFAALGKLSLRDHWDKVEEPKRQEFLNLFTELIEDSSVKKVDIYKSENIKYVEEKVEGDKATVKTEIETEEEEIEVIYLLQFADEKWRVHDMTVDEVSTADNYRTTFNKEITERGFDGLLDKLRKKKIEVDKEKE